RPRDTKARGARSSTCDTSACDALCDMMVKWLTPQPVPAPDRAAQIASQFLANPTDKIAGKCGPAAAYPLGFASTRLPQPDATPNPRPQKHSGMGKDILRRPAREVEPHPIRQEAEAGIRQRSAPLPRQHGVELGLQRVQMQDVRGRIGDLRIGELARAPIGKL